MPVRSALGAAARRTIGRVPLRLWDALDPCRALSLCYHVVSDSDLPHVRALFPYKRAAAFASDIEYLGKEREIVGVGQLVERLDHPGRVARRAVTITFDDGMVECHTVVGPILRRLRARAVFFVTTGCIDNRMMLYRHKAALCVDRLEAAGPQERAMMLAEAARVMPVAPADAEALARFVLRLRADRIGLLDDLCGRVGADSDDYLAQRAPYLTEKQIRELAADGHEIGAHSVTHRDFQVLTEREIEDEVVTSCNIVAAITGHTPVPFAVPFTLEGLDRDLLLRIQRAHPVVGRIFGTAGFKQEPPGLLNRVVADSPNAASDGRSNLPILFREAHAARAHDRLSRFAARVLRSHRRPGDPSGAGRR